MIKFFKLKNTLKKKKIENSWFDIVSFIFNFLESLCFNLLNLIILIEILWFNIVSLIFIIGFSKFNIVSLIHMSKFDRIN